MANKKIDIKQIIVALVIAIIIGLILFLIFAGKVTTKTDTSENLEKILYSGVSEDETMSYLVWDREEPVEAVIVDNQYICLGTSVSVSEEAPIHITETMVFDFYSLKTQELVCSYDIRDYFDEFWDLSEHQAIDDYYIITTEEGDSFIRLNFTHDNLVCYINIATGELTREYQDPLTTLYQYKQEAYKLDLAEKYFGTLTTTNLLEINEINCLDSYDCNNIYNICSEDLPKGNAILYTIFPELKEVRDKEGLSVHLAFDELDDDLVFTLFMEEDAKMNYENCIIYEHGSIDGLQHVVNSKEEFDLYYKDISYEQVFENHMANAESREDDALPNAGGLPSLNSNTKTIQGYRFLSHNEDQEDDYLNDFYNSYISKCIYLVVLVLILVVLICEVGRIENKQTKKRG